MLRWRPLAPLKETQPGAPSPDTFVAGARRVHEANRGAPRGPTKIVRMPNGWEVLLPEGGDLKAWVDRLSSSSSFTNRREALAKIGTDTTVIPLDDRPVVGIVTSEPGQLVDADDITKTIATVEANGCRPVIIPPRADLSVADEGERVHEVAHALVGPLDGMIGLGGDDLHPSIYGRPNTHAVKPDLLRDQFEASLVLAAFDAPLFMLGICRSHQLYNALDGGEIVQDVQAAGLASSSRSQRDFGVPLTEPTITVDVDESSRMARIVGRSSLRTNTSHHQAVGRPGHRFKAVAHSTDAVLGVRLIQGTERRRAMTVQFHPELRPASQGHELIRAVCRRAKIFNIAKRVPADEILGRMRQDRFTIEDYRWAREDLPSILARTYVAAA